MGDEKYSSTLRRLYEKLVGLERSSRLLLLDLRLQSPPMSPETEDDVRKGFFRAYILRGAAEVWAGVGNIPTGASFLSQEKFLAVFRCQGGRPGRHIFVSFSPTSRSFSRRLRNHLLFSLLHRLPDQQVHAS